MVRSWNEEDHPRDDIGRFTNAGGGGSSISADESYNNKMQKRADILYPAMQNKNISKVNNQTEGRNLLSENENVFTRDAAQVVTDEIAGVKKGQEMTLQDAIKDVNPDYKYYGNQTYRTNCQASVIVADARTRGFDVEVSIEYESDFKNKLAERPNIAYIDPKTGKTPEFTKIKVNNETECENWLNNNINPGEKHLFGFTWNIRSSTGDFTSHVLIATKNADNELKFYDPQNRAEYQKGLLSKIKYNFTWSEEPTPPKILRVDNKEFNKAILNRISKPARKK